MIIGQTNVTGAPADAPTTLVNGGPALITRVLQVENFQSAPTPFLPNQRISVAGTNNAPATSGQQLIGVYGKVANGTGVVADGLWPLTLVPSPDAAPPPAADAAGNAALPGSVYYQSGGQSEFRTPGALWFRWGPFASFNPGAGWRRIASENQAGVLELITPTRVVDTRPTGSGIVTTGFNVTTGTPITAGPILANTTRRFLISGKAFPQGASTFLFPPDVSGVLANVTIIGSAGGGFVTVFPGDVSDENRPLASTVNPSTPVAHNFTAVRGGSIAVYSTNTTDIAIDVVGYFLY